MDVYFALTVAGLEEIAGREILCVLRELGKEKGCREDPYVENNFLSGQIYFCCSRLIDPVDIITRVQTVEAICATISCMHNVSLDKEEALDNFVHMAYHWDDDRFDRACNLWLQTRSIRSAYDTKGNTTVEQTEFDFRPRVKRCSCSSLSPSYKSLLPFRINQEITIGNNSTKTRSNNESSNNEIDVTMPLPPPLPSMEDITVSNQLPFPKIKLQQRIQDHQSNQALDLSTEDDPLHATPSFRVTGTREGGIKHPYTSVEIAKHVGGGIFQRYKWQVSLEQYDIHVLSHLNRNTLLVGIILSPSPSVYHTRSRVSLGKTAIMPSVASCISLFAGIRPYEIVLDPMCGSGTIPIEACIQYPGCFAFGGDFSSDAMSESRLNLAFAKSKESKIKRSFGVVQSEDGLRSLYRGVLIGDVIQWDVTHMPLRDNCVDVVVCDMPFGRRSGSYRTTSILYPKFMRQITNALRPGGRIILLTLQKKLLMRVLKEHPSLQIQEIMPCYMGGLELALYRIIYSPTE